jgi:hypothetical protein
MKRLFCLVIVISLAFISCAGINKLKITNENLRKENIILMDQVSSLKGLMPITWEIVEKADDKTLGELTYYLSAPHRLVKDNDSKLVSGHAVSDTVSGFFSNDTQSEWCPRTFSPIEPKASALLLLSNTNCLKFIGKTV